MDESETLEVNPDYLKLLQEHVDLFYDHLQGFNPAAGVSHPSYFPSRSFWTSEEKDIFFHGLSVYSKLRPDLIAADLPNKTVVDVSLFLDLLEEASKEEKRDLTRASFPPALEASEKWIKWEEEQARRISVNQPFWEDHSRRKKRARSVRTEASKRRKPENDVVLEDENQYYEETHGQWKKEDYLKDLSVLHLRAIDHILRDSEDPSKVLGEKHVSDGIEGENDNQVQAADGSCIDPALLESSTLQKIEDPDVLVEPTPRHTSHPTLDDDETVEDSRSLTPRSRRRIQKRLYMRRKRAALSGAAPSKAMSRLKPGRKSNKKATIVTAGHELDVDPSLHQTLAVEDGRDDEEEYSDTPADDMMGAKIGQGAGGSTPHYRIIQELTDLGVDASTLVEDRLGLFHLSNIGKLMDMYASLDDPHGSPEIGSCISASTIQLLHAFVVHFVTEVVGRSISMREQEQASKGHTKVWRMSSGQIPASAVSEAVELMGAQKDVKHHFRSLYERASRSSTLSSTARENSRDTETGDHTGGEEGDGDSADESMEKSDGSFLLSAHREVHGPVVRLVPFTTMSKQYLPCLKPGDANACLEMDDELMADETDEEQLLLELYEEEDVDKTDEMLAQEAEAELWARVQVDVPAIQTIPDRDIPTSTTPSPKSKSLRRGTNNSSEVIKGDGGKLRFANPSRTGIVKSAVYVDDSD